MQPHPLKDFMNSSLSISLNHLTHNHHRAGSGSPYQRIPSIRTIPSLPGNFPRGQRAAETCRVIGLPVAGQSRASAPTHSTQTPARVRASWSLALQPQLIRGSRQGRGEGRPPCA